MPNIPLPADDAQAAAGPALLIDPQGDVLNLTFNRPLQRNAVDLPMAQCLGQAAAQIAATRAKVIVLRARGPAFMAGGDIARTRKLLQASGGRTLDDQLDAERAAFLGCSATSDLREGVDAFLGKRAPRFQSMEPS